MLRDGLLPQEDEIFAAIEETFVQGVRRPGYPADRWAEEWIARRFRDLGLERVRHEPVPLPRWEPRRWSLEVSAPAPGSPGEIDCFPLPHAASTEPIHAELVAWDPAAPERVRGSIALRDVPLMRVPHDAMARLATWAHDPAGTFPDATHVLPFGREFMAVMEPAIAAGAVGFVGVLDGYPGDSKDYYVPYDAVARPIPGVWVRGSAGVRLRRVLADGPARVRLTVDAIREATTCANVVGELPGADDDIVVIGSHHDGPWASAVEDASGIALVLAQAAYWARVPRHERPHRLLFLLNAGHMAGGAGTRAFIDAHRDTLARVVLEVHLEHAANEVVERDGVLVATGHPEARWWFTTRIPRLEAAVRAAIEAEGLARSLMLRPDTFGPHPTTDGGFFHLEGVPLVNYLTAPFYLFDAMDTLDKIHRPSLVPVTRAAARIIASTAGVSAAAMRSPGADRAPGR
jgi:Peptidase family M28